MRLLGFDRVKGCGSCMGQPTFGLPMIKNMQDTVLLCHFHSNRLSRGFQPDDIVPMATATMSVTAVMKPKAMWAQRLMGFSKHLGDSKACETKKARQCGSKKACGAQKEATNGALLALLLATPGATNGTKGIEKERKLRDQEATACGTSELRAVVRSERAQLCPLGAIFSIDPKGKKRDDRELLFRTATTASEQKCGKSAPRPCNSKDRGARKSKEIEVLSGRMNF